MSCRTEVEVWAEVEKMASQSMERQDIPGGTRLDPVGQGSPEQTSHSLCPAALPGVSTWLVPLGIYTW